MERSYILIRELWLGERKGESVEDEVLHSLLKSL